MMRLRSLVVAVALFALLVPAGVLARSRKTLEIQGGWVYNGKTPLRIEQDGQPDIHRDGAKYSTKPWESPIYYSIRFGKWNKPDKGWEIELIHQKLFLQDRPAEVEKFDISHGFNMLMYNKAWKKNHLTYHFGVGPVITHPENTVRGLSLDQKDGMFNDGYYVSGGAMQFAVSKQIPLSDRWFVNVEGKVTGAVARAKVVDGHANVSNVALHALVGIGYKF